jgi:large subunit ribosomal protein L2
MGIKIYRPTTPGRRQTSVDTFDDITKTTPEKSLIRIKKKTGGRNMHGKITVRHRGGGAKQYYRLIDFIRERFDQPATIEAIEYDPNRNARIALVKYADGEKRYIIAPIGLTVGESVVSSLSRVEIKSGNRMPIAHIPLGLEIYDIELAPRGGAKLVRGAGTTAKLMAVEGAYATIKMPSGEIRLVPKDSSATIGQVSNPDAMNIRVGLAGRKRHMGIRPSVRGKVMNPVDHPHGGGEGVNPIGMKAPKTLWGKLALGVPTRKPKKYSDRYILTSRRAAKRK